jgi:hypothetical protein
MCRQSPAEIKSTINAALNGNIETIELVQIERLHHSILN